MAQQLKKKFIGNDQIDGEKLLLEQNQSVKAKDSSGVEQDLIKFGASDEVLVNGNEVSLKSDLDQEILDRVAGDSSTLASAEAYTNQKIAELVDSAPELLDTLNEIAAALGDDPNFVTTVTTLIADVQSNLDQEIIDRSTGDADTLASANAYSDAQDEIYLGVAQDYTDTEIDGLQSFLQGEISSGDSSTLSSANSYTDAEVAVVQGEVDAVESALAQELIDRAAADDLKVDKAGDEMTGTLIINPVSGNAIEAGDIEISENAGIGIAIIQTASDSSKQLVLQTGDKASGVASPGAGLYSGNTTNANSGYVQISSGQASTSGNSGIAILASGPAPGGTSGAAQVKSGNGLSSSPVQIISGNASSGNSGNILLATGSASGTRGVVNINAPEMSFQSLGKITNLLDGTNAQDAVTKSQLDAVDSDLQGQIDAVVDDVSHLVTLSGVAVDSDNLGSFSGSTLSDTETIKSALQALETAVESVSGGGSSTQLELDATQVGAGLDTDGSYIANGAANYISTSSSLADADNDLDAAIKVVADGLAQEIIDRGAADDLKVDKAGDTMSGALIVDESTGTTSSISSTEVLISDASGDQTVKLLHGTGLEVSYTDNTSVSISSTYYEGAFELNSVSLDQSAADGSIVIDALLGLEFNKTDYAQQTVGSVSLASTSLALSHDDQNAGAIGSASYGAFGIQLQVDEGAGQSNFQVFPNEPIDNVAADGSAPTPTVDTHLTPKKYVDDSIALVSDDVSHLVTLSGVDVDSDNLGSFTGTTISDNQTIKAALQDLESAIESVSGSGSSTQTELDATQVGAGLETDGSYTAPVVSNYLSAAVSLKDADSKLDTQIKVVADGLAQEIIDRAADVDAEQSRAEAAEAALQSDISDVSTDIQDHISNSVDAHDASAISLTPSVNGQSNVQDAMEDHESRIDVLESVVWFKEKFLIADSQTSVTLTHTPEANSMSAWVDRLAIHEGAAEDYTILGTTMTFLNDLVAPGESEIGAGDTVYVKYQYKV